MATVIGLIMNSKCQQTLSIIEIMIEDYFKPLALQTDLGLGATADSFYYAAQAHQY